MKYLSMPLNLLKFWYPQSLVFFFRTWKNSIFFFEEDLAVGLMFKLLFVPLFHDSTIVGRFISFFFRTFRIFLGLFTFLLVTLVIILAAIFWFALPPLVIILHGQLVVILRVILFVGVVLFVHHIIAHPPKKLKSIKDLEDIWQCSWIKKSDTNYKKLLNFPQVKNFLLYLEKTPDDFLNLEPNFDQKTWELAWHLGRQLNLDYLGPEHFFVARLASLPNFEESLLKLGLKYEDLIDTLDFLNRKREFWKVVWIFDEDFHIRHLKGVNRGWLGVPTPNLDAVSEDLTRQAAREFIPEFVGRKEIVSQVINILSLEKGKNVLLVGEAGSGKTELVHYLAKMIVSGDAPAALATKRLVRLDLTKLLAGIKTQGELAERVKNVFEEARYCGNIIIFTDEIHELGIGEVGSQFNLYYLMLPHIEAADFQFVTTTEAEHYTRILEKNRSFARLFTKIDLPPATVSDTIHILKNQAIEFERRRKIKTTLLAIRSLAELAGRYIHDLVLPDAALQMFEECVVEAHNNWVNKSVVEKVIQSRSSIPVGEIGVETKNKLLNLEEIIHTKMIDQEEAVSCVCKVLRRAATDLRDDKRPIGSFLFVGPTGVGKTELAKILSETYFKEGGQFLRFDMSEYQNEASINRLIGNSSGEGEGLLTESVHLHPYALILLDEFEKADEKVLTIFLQVFDDGRLTSASGKVVDFTNTIIIATSNAASLTIAKGLESGQDLEQLNKQVKKELLTIFKPELINRFDDVVLFKPLSLVDLQKVVELKIKTLQQQLKEKGYIVEFDSGLIQLLTEKGYDPILGARPLRRLIQDTVEAKLSTMILEGKLEKGQRIVAGESLLG